MKSKIKWWEMLLFLSAGVTIGFYSVPVGKKLWTHIERLIERLFLSL